MNKGETTKEAIIEKAAELFNIKGYASGSLSELMQLTGLKKGGIYNHFSSKEEIAVEAFKYSMKKIGKKLNEVIGAESTPTKKLEALFSFYEKYATKPIIKGGCPILNTIVEVDDTNSLLKEKVQKAFQNIILNLTTIIDEGKQIGEFKKEVNSEEAAIHLISSIEGGILMTRCFNHPRYMKVIMEQLREFLSYKLKR